MWLLGHRGARGESPENTLTGFQYLKTLAVNGVELDLRLSADNCLIIIHDASTFENILVTQKTSSELMNIAMLANYPNERIPVLSTIIPLIAHFQHIQLEVKADTLAEAQALSLAITSFWHTLPLPLNAITTSFNHDYLALIHARCPTLPRGLLFEEDYSGNPIEKALHLECVVIAPPQSFCTTPWVKEAKKKGLKVTPWTVNDPSRVKELANMGVDGIISDYPKKMLQELPYLFEVALK